MSKMILKCCALWTLTLVAAIWATNSYSGSLQSYVVTPLVSANGTISPDAQQNVNANTNITYTATPNQNYMVEQWNVDGHVAQVGGTNFKLSNVTASHTVEAIFAPQNLAYAAGANSYLYYSQDGGLTWRTTPNRPNANNSIGVVFATNTTVFVTTTSKFVFYSSDNGTTWSSTNAVPDSSGIKGIFVTSANKIYVGTKKGHIYSSTNLGATWTQTSGTPHIDSAVNSIYVTANAIYAGLADGNVYYSSNGASWQAINGSPDGSAIRSVFVTNNNLYVNTANEYLFTSPSLTGGGAWNIFAQLVYSMYVNTDGNVVMVATQNGHVFSLVTGNLIGFISYTPINSLFYL